MSAAAIPNAGNAKVPVSLRGVAETLLIPVAARACDARSPAPILGDVTAIELMERIDYDFDKVRMSPNESACIAIRTSQFDQWTASFLDRHPSALVVYLGCGLDARAQRVSWGKEACWVDVDLPEVIDLHKLTMSTPTDREYRVLGADITADGWLESLPRDRPTVIVMEGLMSYLTPEQARSLLKRLVEYFSQGEVLLDCINSMVLNGGDRTRLKSVRDTGAEFKFAVDDLKELEGIDANLKVVEPVRFVEASGVAKLPWALRLQMYVTSWIPGARDAARLVRLGFKNAE